MGEYTPLDWIKDLTSGEFKRGRGQLAKWDPYAGCTRFCCLGVLAERIGAGLRPSQVYIGRDDGAPNWIDLSNDQPELGVLNDIHAYAGWADDDPVIQYIRDVIVPRWEAGNNG